MILPVINALYGIAYIEAWKSQDFKRVWTPDLAISVWHSNQLSFKATDIGFNRVWSCHPATLVRCSNQLSSEATDIGSW